MSVATVQFDYDPDKGGPGDLFLKKGEVILITEKSHTGIWKGKKKDGSIGSFPSNYVRVQEHANAVMFYDDSKTGNDKTSTTQSGDEEINGLVFAKVVTSFDASKLNAESEQKTRYKKAEKLYIDVSKGTVVEILSREPDNWTKVENNGERGLVPSDHLQILETKAKVLYNYKPNSDQTWLLEIKKGDMIAVKKQNPSGWWNGTTSSGKTGLFPGNYVRILHYLSNGELDEEDEDEEDEETSTSTASASSSTPTVASSQSAPSVQTQQTSLQASDSASKIGTLRRVKSEVNEKKSEEVKMVVNNKKAKIIKSFSASKKEQLDVKPGDLVVVTGKYPSGWWEIQNNDGLTGLIPGDVVDIISESLTKEIVRVYSAVSPTTYWTLAINSMVEAREVCGMIAEKLGVEDYFFLFEVQGFSERRLLDSEKPAEIVSSWKASGKDKNSKLVVKQQQTAIGGNKITAVTNPDHIPKQKAAPKEPPVPLPMKVMRFYSLNPEYTYWTLGINPFLTAKDVRETIARKLELDIDFVDLLVEVENKKGKKLSDSDSVVDVSNAVENKAHRFTVSILDAKERKKVEAKKKHESNVSEREKEAEIQLAMAIEEKKKADALERKKREEEERKKQEEELKAKKIEEEARRKQEELKRKEEEEKRRKENEEKRKREEEARKKKEEEDRKNQEELQKKFEERKKKELELEKATEAEAEPTEAPIQEKADTVEQVTATEEVVTEAPAVESQAPDTFDDQKQRETEARKLEEELKEQQRLQEEERLAKQKEEEQKQEEERLMKLKQEEEDEIRRLQEEANAYEQQLKAESEKLQRVESRQREVDSLIKDETAERKQLDIEIKKQEKILKILEMEAAQKEDEQRKKFLRIREEAQNAANQHQSMFEMEEKERIERDQAARKILDDGNSFTLSPSKSRFTMTHATLEERRKQEQQRLTEQQQSSELRDKALYEDREISSRRLALERLTGSPYASRIGSPLRNADTPNDDMRKRIDSKIEAEVEQRRQVDKQNEEEGERKIEAFLFTRGLGEERRFSLDSNPRVTQPGASFKNTLGFFQREDKTALAKSNSIVTAHTKQFKEQLDEVMNKSELSRKKFEQELADSKRSFEKQLEELRKKSDV